MSALPVDHIQVGARHRRDVADVAGLAASMDELGLPQPIVIAPIGSGTAMKYNCLLAKPGRAASG